MSPRRVLWRLLTFPEVKPQAPARAGDAERGCGLQAAARVPGSWERWLQSRATGRRDRNLHGLPPAAPMCSAGFPSVRSATDLRRGHARVARNERDVGEAVGALGAGDSFAVLAHSRSST